MGLFIGTSGWAYSTWKPGFYPAGLGAKGFLSFYGSRFNSVEVNYTFGKPLGITPELAVRWVGEVPDGFQFSFKAPRAVTHSRARLQRSELLEQFLKSLEPFRKAGTLGPVLFQLPPHAKKDPQLLCSFLKGWPKRYRIAFEFRHSSWFDEEVFTVLRKSGAALCVAESQKLVTPELATADFVYYRFRLDKYSKQALALRSRLLADHVNAGRDVYAYLKHIDSPISTRRAKRVKELTESCVGG